MNKTVMENGTKSPKCFSEAFLKSVLDEGFNRTDVKVNSYDLKLATFGGENYCSDIYRVKVEYVYDDEPDTAPMEIHLILKDMKREVEEEMTVKSKETTMYQRVIPEMETILGGKESLAPRLFAARKYDSEMYVFQDLNALGYELKDRVLGLDDKDCENVLKKLGKFHAASMVLSEKFPDLIEKIKDHIFQFGTKSSDLMHTHMTGMLQSAAQFIREWKGYESIAQKIDRIATVFHEKSIESANRSDYRYKVVNHGDLWVNNFLIKDNDVAFIDLQLAFYGSPAIDVNYFLYTSVPLNTLKSRRYELLRIYFNQFQETLQSLNFKNIPDWEDFTYEMRRMEFSGLWPLLAMFPLMVLDKESSKGTDIDTFKNEAAFDAKKKLMFSAKRAQETLKYALDRFNDVGALD